MTLEALLDNAPQLITLIALIALSGLISASETALFALSRHEINRLRQSGSPAARVVLRLRDHPSDLLSTVLLANIAVNILLYSMLGVTAVRLAPDSPFWTTVYAIGGFLMVLFGAEIIPKLLAFALCDRLAPLAAGPLRILEILTWPARRLLGVTLVEPLTRVLGTAEPRPTVLGPDDLQRLIEISQNEGQIGEHENILLHQLMELSELRVNSLLVPRVDVIAFNLDDDPEELVRLITQHRLLRIPVYQHSIDNIRGIVLAREFLLNRDKPISQLIRPAHFIPEQAAVEALLKHFRDSRSQLALVVDEYGGLAGVVALEDVVEALVGELRAPEEHAERPPLQRINAKTYLADAGIDVNDFCRAFDLPVEETRINTLAGLIAEKLDRLLIGHVNLTVARMRRRRVLRVRIELEQTVSDNPDLSILLEQARSSPPPKSKAPGIVDREGGPRS
ncbi:MAG: hemolysin family protein [Phycisphaerae bacterium]